jgi:glycosyltransferase involved in cell wall biosynthesis
MGLFRGPANDVFDWGRAIAASINEVNQTDPIDILEMEESFGWCADVQKLVPIPLVVKLHGPAFLSLVEEDGHTEITRRRIDLEGKALRKMAAITSPSDATLIATESHYELDPQIRKVVRNPIAIDEHVKPWDLNVCDRKTVLFVGRFDKLKGGDTALIAFRRLLDMDESLQLIFVGADVGLTSPTGSRIHFDEFRNSLFKGQSRSRINYLGRLSRSDIFELRRRAMLTVVVSRWENQPNTALEAMIQGCPLVAYDTGGMSEIIDHGVTGLLAQRENIDDLCDKMNSLLTDPLRARKMGESARRSVNERHCATTLVKETVSVYYEAISRTKSARR